MFKVLKEQAFYVTQRVENLYYCYPLKSEKQYLRRYFLVGGLIRVGTFMTVLGSCLHMVKLLNTDSKPAEFIAEDITYAFGFPSCSLLLTYFWLRPFQWDNLCKNVTDFSKFGKPAGYHELIFRLNLTSAVLSIFNILVIIGNSYFKWYDTGCEEISARENYENTCLLVPIWFPNIENVSNFGLKTLFMIQSCCLFWTIPAAEHTAVLSFELMEVIDLRINHLNEYLTAVFDEDDKQITDDRLRFCIHYHQEILTICDQLVREIKMVYGHFAPVSAVVLAAFINLFILTQNLGIVGMIFSWSLSLLVVCYIGQRIQSGTLSISDAALASKWYKGDIGHLRDLKFIIMRSQKLVPLKTHPSGQLDYNLFINICKAAYSYWTLMRV